MDLKLSTARNRVFSFAGVSITSLSVTISKDGGAFASPVGSLTQIGSTTFYTLALATGDTDTLGDLAYKFSDTVLGVIAPDNGDVDQVVPVAPDVTLADGVAHGGTPGSSTATISFSQMVGESQTTNTPAFNMTGNGTAPGLISQGGTTDAPGGEFIGGGTDGIGLACLGAGATLVTRGRDNCGLLVLGGSDGGNAIEAIGDPTFGGGGMIILAGDGSGGNHGLQIFGSGSGHVGVSVFTSGFHGISIQAGSDANSHDINLGGSGDIKGDFVVPADGTGQATGIMGMIFYLYQRFFGKKIYDKIGNTVKTYQADGTTVRTTQTTSSDSSADEIDAAS